MHYLFGVQNWNSVPFSYFFMAFNPYMLLTPVTTQWLFWSGLDVSLSSRWITCLPLSIQNRHLGWFYCLLFSVLSYCGNPSKVVPQLGFSFFGFCFWALKKKRKKIVQFCFIELRVWGFFVFLLGTKLEKN